MGLTLLTAGIAFWLQWEPPATNTPQTLLPVWRSPNPTNPAPALPGAHITNLHRSTALTSPPASPVAIAAPSTNGPTSAGTNSSRAPVWKPRPVLNILEAQIALARKGISPGSIDGTAGSRSRNALKAFQASHGLRPTGELDRPTRNRLELGAFPYTHYTVTAADLGRLLPVGRTWLERSQQPRLDFETLEELVGEATHSDPNFIRQLNQSVDWTRVEPGTSLMVPNIPPPPASNQAAWIRIHLADRTLQAFDDQTNLLAHFPCSIGRAAESRPVGELHVTSIVPNPSYVFKPENFPNAPEAKELNTRLVLPPGPNNPVGVVWIGLDRPGYGIHGTPHPDRVGQAESLGCFRLANWNVEHLRQIAWIGMPVLVEP